MFQLESERSSNMVNVYRFELYLEIGYFAIVKFRPFILALRVDIYMRFLFMLGLKSVNSSLGFLFGMF